MASIFTRIIEGEIPGRLIWRDDLCVAMIDIRPLHRGHTLVIPIAEIDQWTDLPPETTAHVFQVAQSIADAQKTAIRCERIGLLIAGFEVPHAHVHVVPMDSMADLNFQNAETNPDADDLDRVADELRTALVAAGHTEAN